MSDLFHEAVPADFVAAVWRAMQTTPQHTYQILTKRPDRMAEITASLPVLPNVWLGTSVESADYLGRIDDLRKVDAAGRFVSFEPLLGSVARADLTGIQWAIVGGESGPRSRPMAEQWSRRLKAHVARQGLLFSSSSGAAFAKRAPAGTIAGARAARRRDVMWPMNMPRQITCSSAADEAAMPFWWKEC
jgi:protein gp37